MEEAVEHQVWLYVYIKISTFKRYSFFLNIPDYETSRLINCRSVARIQRNLMTCVTELSIFLLNSH
jgi:hypothetical protein